MHVAILAGFAALPSAEAANGIPIGFVNHFPMVKHEDETIRDTGASVILVRAPWPFIEPEEGEFSFALLDEQLEWAYAQGLHLVYVLEAGPAHAAGVAWLIEKLQASGETMAGQDGTPARDPSMFSETYRRYLSRYIRRTVQYLASHRHSEVVYGYDNGCEWWYPLSISYGPLDAAAFTDRLRERYGTLEALNARWGTGFADWGDVTPPQVGVEGGGVLPQGHLVPASASLDACYCTNQESHVPVTPGQKLTFEVECELDNTVGGSAKTEIAWLKADEPQPIAIAHSKPIVGESGKGTLRVEAAVPDEAARAWLLMKATGVGKVTFTRVVLRDGAGTQLAPNPGLDPGAGGWHFIQWRAGEAEALEHGWTAPGGPWISYQPSCELASGAACPYPLAEVHDWLDFRWASVADFLDWFAAEIKAADPERPVVTYLTFSFANPFEWDYTQQMAIGLDYIARAGEHQDVFGMQLASASGDCDSVTCALDMVRKYGKPMWAIDLQDFSRGTDLGAEELTRVSLSVLQHGGSGIQYYCWYGTPAYNYAELGVPALQQMIGQVRSVADDLRGAQVDPQVALIMPRMPLYRFLDEPANDWADFVGWYKVLVRLGVCPDVFTLDELPGADLRRYRAVIAPDCAYLPRAALSALCGLTRSDTALLTSGRFALLDMTGRPIAESERPAPAYSFRRAVGRLVLGETRREPSASNTPPRLVCAEGYPSLDRPECARIAHRLEAAGVPILHPAGDAPVTTVPFRQGRRRLALTLPDRDWSGTVKLDGQRCEVGPLGTLRRLARERDR
jgi:hypothetical protein